ncbi:MAG: hypothetical protein UH080_01335 [Ruminococcus sp.]|nr:hypothetical protein [Ruminococcus sp.]
MKKFISVMLAALMLASTMSATIVAAAEVTESVEETTTPVAGDVYVVAGSEQLCGVNWKGNAEEATDNVMVEVDGVYTKVFTDVQPANGLQLKVVKNNTDWIGDETGNNITFNVTTACDVTVTFDAVSGKITVTGDGVEFETTLEFENVFAVGAGDGAWINGVVWNPAAEENMMAEVAENVYEITFSGVEGPFEDYQVKFALDGEWTHSWGGAFVASGEAFDGVYNGDNIVVNVPYELANVTLSLDLSAFDYASKTGAKITITVVDMTETEPTEETTVAEDTTVETEPTEETTVAEDTTVETEPVEDTTASEETTAPVAEDVYVVAGSELLCGVNWKGNAEEAPENVMVAADGVYTKVFTDVQPAEGLQLKVVKNNTDWIGDETGNNITFNVTTACDVTVTFDAATGKITVTGDGVEFETTLEFENVFAVGAGDGAWINGVVWNPAAEENKMTEVAENVYEITFTGVEGPFEDYQVKFALDGEWTHSWGGAFVASGEAFDGVYNGDNIVVNVPYELADVTLTLDLSAFDYASKTGAKITITVVDATEVDVVKGDLDGNGVLDVADVTFLQMSIAGYEECQVAAEAADFNGDDVVSVDDVTAMQFAIAGIFAE